MGKVKVWDSFSILLVLAMLLFLLPAAVLLGPTATVVLATDSRTTNTTRELTGNFVLDTVVTSGTLGGWTTGDGGRAPWYNAQYTREGVSNSTSYSGSGWRNYTLITGNVTGNISGTMSLRFNHWYFNYPYPYTPVYRAGSTGFGFMFGKGFINTSSGNIPFTFICDLDGNQNFTNATGKGIMVSNNETGIYVGRQVMGSFTMNISNTSYYSGTMNLRDYPTEEIYPEGWTNVSSAGASGRIKKDNTDAVQPGNDDNGCNFPWFDLARGDIHTDTVTGVDDNPGLEEATPGEEGSQTVKVSAMGAGGLVNNSRNGFVHAGSTTVSGRGTGVICTRIEINDTYAATGNDGSTQGWMNQVQMLDFPYIATGFGGGWIFQYGSSMNNFNQWNISTGDYLGIETNGVFRNAIRFASSTPYNTYSNTTAWDLRPTPKVDSCTPSNGTQGTNMTVTLGGRYFLRHSSLCPFVNRSTISFGPDITVINWTVSNASPIDNAITVNIAIGAGAAPGARDVNVTAWFGNNTNPSTWANETGALVNGFTVLSGGVPNSTITGMVYEANASVVPSATVNLTGPRTGSTTTNATGWYVFTVNTTGNYTVNATKGGLTYVAKWANVTTNGSTVPCNFTGVDAPYPKAPNVLYCIKCSNLWLYEAWYDALYGPGFGLNATRVSDVLYAWTHPS